MDIPLNANVECTDGLCGQSTYVIINPVTQQVTNVVVREKKRPRAERLVPIGNIEKSTHNLICLCCTKDKLAKMEPFIGTYYIWVEHPLYEATLYVWPFAVPTALWRFRPRGCWGF